MTDERTQLSDAAVHRLAFDYLRLCVGSIGLEVTEDDVEGLLDVFRRYEIDDEYPYRVR